MEKRRFPRIDRCIQQKILHLSPNHHFVKDLVLSRNISAGGFSCRSPKPYQPDELILVHLDDSILGDLQVNKARVMKAGNYFLGKVVRAKPIADGFFEIGCCFVEITDGNQEKIEFFTRLMNEDIAEQISNSSLS